MIEVGKCYKADMNFRHTGYFKILEKLEQGCYAKGIDISENKEHGHFSKCSFIDLELDFRYDNVVEIPESEYKAKLQEVKQILEEMEK